MLFLYINVNKVSGMLWMFSTSSFKTQTAEFFSNVIINLQK